MLPFVSFSSFCFSSFQDGNTGTHSVYTEYSGYEVMFHVASLLPYSASNKQQLERKRHVGNDIGVIIFQDNESTAFCPTFMRTHFNRAAGTG